MTQRKVFHVRYRVQGQAWLGPEPMEKEHQEDVLAVTSQAAIESLQEAFGPGFILLSIEEVGAQG